MSDVCPRVQKILEGFCLLIQQIQILTILEYSVEDQLAIIIANLGPVYMIPFVYAVAVTSVSVTCLFLT